MSIGVFFHISPAADVDSVEEFLTAKSAYAYTALFLLFVLIYKSIQLIYFPFNGQGLFIIEFAEFGRHNSGLCAFEQLDSKTAFQTLYALSYALSGYEQLFRGALYAAAFTGGHKVSQIFNGH